MNNRIYVGCRSGCARQIFFSEVEPTEQTHGHIFNAIIGPFYTVAGAEFMANCGEGNPHCQTVEDAERIAKEMESISGESITQKLVEMLKAMVKHAEGTNYAFYVEGKHKAMVAAFRGQKELLQAARALIESAPSSIGDCPVCSANVEAFAKMNRELPT